MGKYKVDLDKVTFRFMAKVVKRDNGCWYWSGMKRGKYGLVRIGGRRIAAHRASYQLFVGEISGGLLVCHTCDNPICVNPDHLFLGTYLDNYQDMIEKGREVYGDRRGSKNSLAKLTEDDVREIRDSSETQVKIGKRFGVSQSVISEIRSRKLWSHVR